MAKRKSSGNIPQPQFNENHTSSQHDRRERLSQPNPDRQPTTHAKFPLIGDIALLVAMMQCSLDSRTAFRFSILFAGILLAKGRRTVSSWFRAAGVLVVLGPSMLLLWRESRAVGVRWVSILLPESIVAILGVPSTWQLIAYLCVGYPEDAVDEVPELEREGWKPIPQ